MILGPEMNAFESRIACRRLPNPESLVLFTVNVSALAQRPTATKSPKPIATRAGPRISPSDRRHSLRAGGKTGRERPGRRVMISELQEGGLQLVREYFPAVRSLSSARPRARSSRDDSQAKKSPGTSPGPQK